MASDARTASSIVDAEIAHFDAQAADWWNPKGSSAMLHRINPVRLGYIRSAVNSHWAIAPDILRPLTGRRVLDVGCGAGLLCEPLARMGADVTGIDAAPSSIAAARDHADAMGLSISYRQTGVESLDETLFDLVTSMEVVEHVAHPASFIKDLARCVAPGGLLILSTPNRTARSRLTIITLAEGFGMIPKGTHDWSKFITPDELEPMLADAGLRIIDRRGILFRPDRGFMLGEDMAMNYIVTAQRVEAPATGG